jgi:hypothetical protein
MTHYIKSLLLLLLSCSNTIYSQNEAIDSLKNVLRKQTDTSRVNTLNSLAWELKSSNPDSAQLLSK